MENPLPFSFARQHQLLLDQQHSVIYSGPDTSASALMQLRRQLQSVPQVESLTKDEFEGKLREFYGSNHQGSASVMADLGDFADMESAAREVERDADLLDGTDDAPVIKLLNAIFLEALSEKASDIHIEPYEDSAAVRFRLDGVLRSVLNPSVHIAPLLVSRIKVMAKLDIAEKRLPQDGRMSVRLGGRAVDMRVSTLPSSYGERVVMRLLDKDATHLDLNDLGMDQTIRSDMEELVKRPHGIILVTGPTGSGKTTTLYAALERMDRQLLNIMTVEDPIEYDLKGISQTQVNTRSGMTFAKGLRALLRQDPDVILIGEIRDKETAEIATQASLTGHLVLSTLHTNTALGAITRLQDLGVDSFLLSSTIRGILAQRLVRKLCDDCKEPISPSSLVQEKLGIKVDDVIYSAKGCKSCNQTGYTGRLGLFELVQVDDSLQQMIHDKTSEGEMERYIRQQTPSIIESGYALVRQGKTSFEEVLRVTSI